MKMSMGMNTNVQYKGRLYHIQTEDGGADRPTLTTLLFKDGGTVVSSKRRDYTDLLQSDSCRETVTALMKEQHKTMIRMLVRGEIEGLDTLAPEILPAKDFPKKTIGEKTPVKTPEEKQTGPLILNGVEKNLDTLILEYLAKRDLNVV